MAGTQQQPEHYDLCIIGAGIAGLNALHVASGYLRPDQRVALVDRNDQPGGMWVNTYDYVRLHQPHPFFTAGNIAWTLGKERSHLAAKDEVLDHLRYCVDEARKRVSVTELFGHEMKSLDEVDGVVQVTCTDSAGHAVTLTADNVINAAALDIETNPPLQFSSTRVRSVSPDSCDVRTGEIAADPAPVWIIGSGKTAMDTAHALVTQDPGREVNVVAGSGTFFVNRDLLYPIGARRWWRGIRPNGLITEMADRFDGTNEVEVFDWVRTTAGAQPIADATHFLLGIISEGEAERIRSGLHQVVMDHLVDVADADADGAVRLLLRSGNHVDIEPGSWIVNCTGYLIHRERIKEVPYVSPSGRVVTIGTSAMFGFSSFAGYFLTHLLFLGNITQVPLYQANGNELLRASKSAAVAGAVTMSAYNLGLVFDQVPAKVFADFGLDFDRWYPFPRRLAGQLRFVASHKRKRERYRRALDTLGKRFGVEVGPAVAAE